MNHAEISKLTERENFQLMEALWEDMRKRADESEIPPQPLESLEASWAGVQSRESALLDWDEVKDTIRRP